MRLQWKYSLVINLTVLIVLVAFYFFDSIRVRRDMNALHALGAERGAELKKIAENTILPHVVKELETAHGFDAARIDAVLQKLKREHPDMQEVRNVHISLDNTRIRSSLLPHGDITDINLDAATLAQIETKGAKIDTMEGQNATAIVIKYLVSLATPKQIELSNRYGNPPLQLAYETILDRGSIHFELWKALVANNIHMLDAAVTVEEQGTRWQIADKEKENFYTLWKDGDTLWVQKRQVGYIRVLFNVPDIDKSIRNSLLMHAALIVIVGALLVILIDFTTNHLVMKPLERMTRIIQSGKELEEYPGVLRNQTPPIEGYSSDEIGKATYNLARMLWQLRESHSKRIAALGQLTAGVAHEIRNPLNSIGMTAQHLKMVFSQPKVEPDDIEEAKELLDIVNQKIEELKQISEQFLSLNRPRKLNIAPVNLNSLVEGVLSEFVLIAKNADVSVIRNYDMNLPNVELDVALMRQTLFNFVQNSIQAMPKGGSIYITTSQAQWNNQVYVVLEIRDTGIGIPEEIQGEIYDAYFTTKDATGGIGLGLAISHQIITAHHGKIDMKSKMGMGTAFKISLPLNSNLFVDGKIQDSLN